MYARAPNPSWGAKHDHAYVLSFLISMVNRRAESRLRDQIEHALTPGPSGLFNSGKTQPQHSQPEPT